MSEAGALAGFRVLDLTDDLGAYASRLMADLGAAVVRVDPPGRPIDDKAPVAVGGAAGQVGLFDRFVNVGKERLVVDPATSEGAELLERLVAEADVLFQGSWQGSVADPPGGGHSRLVRVVVTPFGSGVGTGRAAVDDLLVLAAGGLLALGGYQDAGPVAAHGEQAGFAASIYAAVAALVGLLDREHTGEGSVFDVSAQECVAQGLEDSVATFVLTGRERDRYGEVSREAGSGVYACMDGYVSMIAGRLGTARAWKALTEWLNAEHAPGAESLLEPRWSEFAYRQSQEAVSAFTAIFEGFAASRSKGDLYRDAQALGIALSPVNETADLFEDPQLAARGFFVDRDDPDLGRPLKFPGPPYLLSGTPAVPGEIVSGSRTESGGEA